MFQQMTYVHAYINFISVTCSPHNAKTTISRYQRTNRLISVIGKTANNRPVPIIRRLSVHFYSVLWIIFSSWNSVGSLQNSMVCRNCVTGLYYYYYHCNCYHSWISPIVLWNNFEKCRTFVRSSGRLCQKATAKVAVFRIVNCQKLSVAMLSFFISVVNGLIGSVFNLPTIVAIKQPRIFSHINPKLASSSTTDITRKAPKPASAHLMCRLFVGGR